MDTVIHKIFLVVVSIMVLNGCYSKYPLSEKGKYIYDKRLVGLWETTTDSGSIAYMHVADSDSENVFNVVSVTHPKKGDFTVSRYVVFAASENNTTGYLSLVNVVENEDGYHFAKYSFKNDNLLNICVIPIGDLVKAVESKKLDGKVNKNNNFAFLTGDTKQLRNFFLSPNGSQMFSNCKVLARAR